MRIIAGHFRGKKLIAPDGWDTRPTSDRAREGVFNLVAHRYRDAGWSLEGATVLDVFAGTGAMGLEAFSRGAAHVVFFETGRSALEALRDNVRGLKADAQTRIITASALSPPSGGEAATIAFFDAPYGQNLTGPALTAMAERGWLAKGGLCVAEMAAPLRQSALCVSAAGLVLRE